MTTYQSHIKSAAWKRKRLQVIQRAGGTCERCGKWAIVNVHHLTYERVGDEELSDLIGVCPRCHEELHDQ